MAPSGSHLSKKTAKERAREYKHASFYEDGGVLFCRACARAVDYRRKSTIDEHIQSNRHRKNAETRDSSKRKSGEEPSEDVAGGSGTPRKQSRLQTLESAMTAGEARHDIVLKFLDALISANIPLEKVDNPKLRTFLQTHVRNGGSVPGSDALRRRLPELFEKHETALKAMFQGTTVSVVIDETTDDRSKSVVNVLFVQSARSARASLQPVLVEVKFVDEVNSSVIGRIVTRTLTKYGIEFEDVTGFVSDNAAYMVKSFKECIKPLCECAVHITCVAHTVNIVGSTLQASFPLVDKFVACMKKAFRLSSRKRAFYKAHLEKCGVECAKTPPAPVKSRWNSWIEAVEQHSAYFEHYPSLLRQVYEKYGDAACVDSLLELLNEHSIELKYCMRCIAVFGKKVASLLKAAEGQRVACHKAYNALFTLWGYLEAAAQEDFETQLKKENIAHDEAHRIANKMKAAMSKAASKALVYLEKSDTWKFFKSVRCLDPLQIGCLSEKRSEFAGVPGLGEDSLALAAEWQVYLKSAQELKSSDRDLAPFLSKQEKPGEDFDVLAFWAGMEPLTPTLSSIALKYLSMPINSVDAERSFSRYGDIVSHKRHSLSEESTKHHLMLSHNSFLLI
ncbi:uncharacterized protein LOC115322563 [Ixodes scapularis]|uniref:uncharacterized protein LOC115322563 n=1 Tax=Ixodes scapularis TaxID=6945 RepID=UPI001A9FC151|nr:uncharacterized protein LOC115322563 [Ixodes scapularis]